MKCPECGKVMGLDDKHFYCPDCGKDICKKCGGELDDSFYFCPKCGTKSRTINAIGIVFKIFLLILKNIKVIFNAYGFLRDFTPHYWRYPSVGADIKFGYIGEEEQEELKEKGIQGNAVIICTPIDKNLEEVGSNYYVIKVNEKEDDILYEYFSGIERIVINFEGKYKDILPKKINSK